LINKETLYSKVGFKNTITEDIKILISDYCAVFKVEIVHSRRNKNILDSSKNAKKVEGV
jgi:hypothetical protein